MQKKSSENKRMDGGGSLRQTKDGKWECIIQSKYLNPETGKPKRIKRTASTKNDATKQCKMAVQAWEKQIERKKNEKIDPKKTFGDYMTEYLDSEVKPTIKASGYKSYYYALKANFYNYKISKLQLHMLNTVEFEEYFDTLHKEKAAKTVELPIQLAKRCCKWLYGRSLIEENYAEFAKTKRQKKDEFFRELEKDKESRKEIYSNEDIVKFYDAYKNNVSEYAAAVILILETMMRGSELLALGLDDIDLDNNTIRIRSAVSDRFVENDVSKGLEKYIKVPKNGEERVIVMSPLARECVEFMIYQTALKSRANPNNLLFPSYIKQGKMRSMDAFEIQFKDLCNKIGVDRDVRSTKLPNGKVINKGLCVHALRHTAITIANTAPGANIINTALAAGHKAVRTENIYTHTNLEALKSITTPSTAILRKQESPVNSIDQEMYEMYLKLKDKFEG